jgi:hypothetical protein
MSKLIFILLFIPLCLSSQTKPTSLQWAPKLPAGKRWVISALSDSNYAHVLVDSIAQQIDTNAINAKINKRIKGSGTIDYIPIWASSDSLSNSFIKKNAAGYIEINNTNANGKFDINSTNNNVFVNGGNATATGYLNNAFSGLNSITSGILNNSFGYNSLYSLNTGGFNNGFGVTAGQNLTSGYYNNYFGYQAGLSNSTGSNNNAFGTASLQNSTGSNNNAFGYASGLNKIGGSNNVLLGNYTNSEGGSASYNIAIGEQAIQFFQGNNNIGIGHLVGYADVSSASNIGDMFYVGNYFSGNTAWLKGKIGANGNTSYLQIDGKFKYNFSSPDNATGLVGKSSDGFLKDISLGSGLSLSGAGVLSSNVGGSNWTNYGSNIHYNLGRVLIGNTDTIYGKLNVLTTASAANPIARIKDNSNNGIYLQTPSGTGGGAYATELTGGIRCTASGTNNATIRDNGGSAGTAGQLLTSQGANNWTWASVPNELPGGGLANQVLKKNSTNNGLIWANDQTGSGVTLVSFGTLSGGVVPISSNGSTFSANGSIAAGSGISLSTSGTSPKVLTISAATATYTYREYYINSNYTTLTLFSGTVNSGFSGTVPETGVYEITLTSNNNDSYSSAVFVNGNCTCGYSTLFNNSVGYKVVSNTGSSSTSSRTWSQNLNSGDNIQLGVNGSFNDKYLAISIKKI